MAVSLPNASRSAAADAVVGRLDADTDPGYVEIRTGASPGPNTAASGTLLVSIDLNDPSFTPASNGVATADVTPEPSGTAVATGTAGYFRMYDGAGNAVLDGTCGTSGADMILNTTSISTGLDVRITSLTVTMPQS